MTRYLVSSLPPDIKASGCVIFKVHISDREEWINGTHPYIKPGVVWYTDGSKTENGVGAGA